MRLFLLLCLVVFMVSCGKKKEPQPQEEPAVEQEAPAPETVFEETVPVEPVQTVVNTHEVKKGECLWFIAGYDDIYGDPFKWPKIYEANKDQISNPDLIYPDQVFTIPR